MDAGTDYKGEHFCYLLLCCGGFEDVVLEHVREALSASGWQIHELTALTDPLNVSAGHAGLGPKARGRP